MIVEIPDENSIIKWKYKDTDDWTTAEVSDLIKAYEERRPKGKWIKDYTHEEHGETSIVCSICSHSVPYKSNFCSNCGADMRKENKYAIT